MAGTVKIVKREYVYAHSGRLFGERINPAQRPARAMQQKDCGSDACTRWRIVVQAHFPV
jgi:hypothetical protein